MNPSPASLGQETTTRPRSLREAEPAELEILRGSLFDAEVWSIAVGTGLQREHFSTPRTARIWMSFEQYYAVESKPPIAPEVLHAGYGLSADDAHVLVDGLGCGSRGAAELSRAIQSAAKRRAHRERMLQAAAALQRGDEDEARALLALLDAPAEAAVERSRPQSPAEIVTSWRTEGPLSRLATGIVALDRMCRGGFPIPWRVVIVGAPSAGKTASAAAVGFEIARELGCVGFLAVDEEPDDITIRLAQMVGFTVADAEQRDPEVLSDLAAALEPLHVRLYDGDFTIDAAAEDLGAWASSIGLPGVLIVDSLQTARSNRVTDTMTAREQVEANVSALRAATKKYRLLTIATSEANRNAYRSEQAEQNDLAAGAETRAIEFGAQTLLVLRTPKDSPDVVHVKVSKNRRAQRGEFWLRIDRETHALTECANPADNPEASQKRADEKRERDRARVERDANELIRVAARAPGLSERDLRTAAKVAGLGWGRDRFEIAKRRCIEGTPDGRLVNRGDDRASRWFVEHMQEEHGAPPSGVPSVPGTVPGTPKQENGHGRW